MFPAELFQDGFRQGRDPGGAKDSHCPGQFAGFDARHGFGHHERPLLVCVWFLPRAVPIEEYCLPISVPPSDEVGLAALAPR
jgi:hypothetical protein